MDSEINIIMEDPIPDQPHAPSDSPSADPAPVATAAEVEARLNDPVKLKKEEAYKKMVEDELAEWQQKPTVPYVRFNVKGNGVQVAGVPSQDDYCPLKEKMEGAGFVCELDEIEFKVMLPGYAACQKKKQYELMSSLQPTSLDVDEIRKGLEQMVDSVPKKQYNRAINAAGTLFDLMEKVELLLGGAATISSDVAKLTRLLQDVLQLRKKVLTKEGNNTFTLVY